MFMRRSCGSITRKPLARNVLAIGGLALGASLVTSPAWAQDEPGGLLSQSSASSGTTDLAQEGFQAAAKTDAAGTDATNLAVSAGGNAASGNSKALFVTAASDFRLRRSIHQFKAAASANYGGTAPDRAAPIDYSINNYQGKVRYDVFVIKQLAGFFQISGRHDPNQGLDLRLNVDPGVAYYFIDEEKHQLSTELGYDLQYDVRSSAAISEAPEDVVIEKTETRHNARAAVTYDNKLSKTVTLNTFAEYLQALSPFEDEQSKHINFRLNWGAGLTSSVADALAIATSISIAYDNNPVQPAYNTDVLTAVSLVYNMY
jgi:putative salt-induced outer membrane protein